MVRVRPQWGSIVYIRIYRLETDRPERLNHVQKYHLEVGLIEVRSNHDSRGQGGTTMGNKTSNISQKPTAQIKCYLYGGILKKCRLKFVKSIRVGWGQNGWGPVLKRKTFKIIHKISNDICYFDISHMLIVVKIFSKTAMLNM